MKIHILTFIKTYVVEYLNLEIANKLNQNYDQERIQMNPRVQTVQTANYNQDNFFQDMSRDSASYAMSM